MGLFDDVWTTEWTPAAIVLGIQTVLIILTAVTFLSHQTDSFYDNEPHTKKVMNYPMEFFMGAGFLAWATGMTGALITGGAQLMCLLQQIPMAYFTYYHYIGQQHGAKITSVILNVVIGLIMIICALVSPPTVYSTVWNPAACFLAFQTFLIGMTGLTLMISADGFYKMEPHTMAMMNDHPNAEDVDPKTLTKYAEMFAGGSMLAWTMCLVVTIVAGGAADMCIMQLLPMSLYTYYHFKGGHLPGAIVNLVFMAILTICAFISF
mmetsp:Transcript_16441/g.30282  ORF Transcript_16441/g.30282 Transcript_16441/m.30282 type:complete len:264 (-) Transcript_16441:297-1088(-)